MSDLMIRNATLVDGTGAAARQADVTVRDGRIAEVGGSGANGGRAAEVVDAEGLVLAPGLIDTHTHYDAQITWDPTANPSPTLGVTTVLIGNCGFTVAPCHPAHRDLIMRNLTHVEGMSLDALRAGLCWDFETFPEYLEAVARRGVGPNLACYVGHSSVRTWVMGPEASERAATDAEIAAMRALVLEGMAAGAVGFASSTFQGHNGENGVPMPSRLAEDREFQALVGALGEAGAGVFMLTKGDRTDYRFLESLAADSGRPVIVAALLHDKTAPTRAFDELRAMDEAGDRGREMYGQVSCCPLTMEFDLAGAYLMEGFDSWRPAMAANGGDALRRVYGDPGFRDQVKAEMAKDGGLRAFNGEWSQIKIAAVGNPAHAGAEGKTVADIAAETGKHPLDAFLDFGLDDNLETTFTAALLNSDESAVARLVTHPRSTVALSDAGAHLTFFCDAGYGLHLLGHWVRDRGALSLEQAVHRLTGRQADIYRIPERGRIVPGHFADLLLFDPKTVARTPNRRVNDLPTGAGRLTCGGVGVHGVWVNGTRLVDEDGIRDAAGLPGKVLREFMN